MYKYTMYKNDLDAQGTFVLWKNKTIKTIKGF